MKEVEYVINFDKYKLIEIHWVVLWMILMRHDNNVAYLIVLELNTLRKFTGNKISQQIFIEFKHIDFILNNKKLADFTDLFSSKNFIKNGEIMLKYFH